MEEREKNEHISFAVSVSVAEIYNEQIRDLLTTETVRMCCVMVLKNFVQVTCYACSIGQNSVAYRYVHLMVLQWYPSSILDGGSHIHVCRILCDREIIKEK